MGDRSDVIMLYRGDRYIGYNVLRVHRKNFPEGYSAVHRL
jgi:hypothetical protein